MMIFANSAITTSQIVMLGMALVALTLLMLATRKRLRRLTRQVTMPAHERFNHLREQSANTRGIDEAMLELDKLSRQVHGRIDIKLAKLETVIRDADDRIKSLSRLAQQTGEAPQVSPNRPTRKAQPSARRPHLDIALTEEMPGKLPPTDPVVTGMRATIYRLADEGMSPLDIAERVGQPTGEVELILALRRTVQESSTGH